MSLFDFFKIILSNETKSDAWIAIPLTLALTGIVCGSAIICVICVRLLLNSEHFENCLQALDNNPVGRNRLHKQC